MTSGSGEPEDDRKIRKLALSGASLGGIAASLSNAAARIPDLQMPHLDVDTAIRLRWTLRDIKGKRTQLSPVNPNDLRTLIEMRLVEMRDEIPALTNEGERAIDWG